MFQDLFNDEITIISKFTGQKHENIRAAVTRDHIHFDNAQIIVQPGDVVLRNMSNGGESTYEVLDPGFHEAFHGIPAHYQMKVRQLGIPEARSAVKNLTVNFHGDNARFNSHSIDNSVNISNSPIKEELLRLHTEIQDNLSGVQRAEALELFEEIAKEFNTQKPRRGIVSALLTALPNVANIATIASLILQGLGK